MVDVLAEGIAAKVEAVTDKMTEETKKRAKAIMTIHLVMPNAWKAVSMGMLRTVTYAKQTTYKLFEGGDLV